MSVDSGGATPDVPVSAVRAGSPRQMGCVGDGDALRLPVLEPDGVAVPEGVLVGDPVGVRVCDALGVGVRVSDALGVGVRVADALGVALRVPLGDGVPVVLPDPVFQVLPLPVRVALPDCVRVTLAVPLLDGVPVELAV